MQVHLHLSGLYFQGPLNCVEAPTCSSVPVQDIPLQSVHVIVSELFAHFLVGEAMNRNRDWHHWRSKHCIRIIRHLFCFRHLMEVIYSLSMWKVQTFNAWFLHDVVTEHDNSEKVTAPLKATRWNTHALCAGKHGSNHWQWLGSGLLVNNVIPKKVHIFSHWQKKIEGTIHQWMYGSAPSSQ